MKKSKKSQHLFFILLGIILILGTLNIAKVKGYLIPLQPSLDIQENTIKLSDITLDQKIAQMIIVHGSSYNKESWKNLQLGGIHLFAMEKEEDFRKVIQDYQKDAPIPFFVTVDFEGCLNPFANFKKSIPTKEIKSIGDAYEKGYNEGKYLEELGFTINFAPVVDVNDEIWKCRSFPGNSTQVGELSFAYTTGLQTNKVIATAKHYPGKTLVVRDPHKHIVLATIEEEDLIPFKKVSATSQAIMVSHLITTGAVSSQNKPSSGSQETIDYLKENFDGLIISDEINMLGLKEFYSSLDEMYVAVFASGNDVILNFNDDPNEIYHMIQVVKEAVEDKKIPLEMIDSSVTKILQAKGFVVK